VAVQPAGGQALARPQQQEPAQERQRRAPARREPLAQRLRVPQVAEVEARRR